MKAPWQERFRMWLCKVFGHKVEEHMWWYHNGQRHTECQRCRHIISEDVM